MVHLHVHSCLSLRDSIIKTDDLIERLNEIGQDTVAITDHGASLGGVSLYKKLKENNIKYIHGCELYICDDVSVKDRNNKYYHIIVLCKNETGRINLNKLITISNKPENKYVKPRVDFEILKEHSDGLVVLSACLAGEVDRALLSGDYELAKQIASKYKQQFGDDYYLEIQSHDTEDQIETNIKIKELADDLDIQCVVTTDAHYVWEKDKIYQSKFAFNGSYKEDGETYKDCFVQSEKEVRNRLQYFDDEFVSLLINNTHIISEKCNIEMPISAPIMPEISVPDQYSSSKDWLTDLCVKGFSEKLNIDYYNRCVLDDSRYFIRNTYDENGEVLESNKYFLSQTDVDEYIKRFEYELDSLHRMGFVDYILLVYSYCHVGKRRGIGRGSGGGSLINYLVDITDIDPIEHGLYFERFIDVGAIDLLESGKITKNELKIPDIDLDFSSESCEDVLRFLYEKYGETHVASIGKFGNNKTKGTIRDMCKALGISLREEDAIAKSFGDYEMEEIDMMVRGSIKTPENAREAVYYTKEYSELFDYVRKLNGLPKSFGLHACGKVVVTKDLDYFLPSCYDSSGIRYLQGDMHDVEDVGIVKIDVLGLRTLDQEYDTLEMSGEEKSFINTKQDMRDPKVMEVFRNGDTIGIFQFSSRGMRQTLKKMDVRSIDDLSIANALFRPGSMAYIDNFCNRRKGKEDVTYIHDDLIPILKNTYGIIVFQEQLIEIGRMAGLKNPDMLRRATAKKKADLLDQVKPELESKLYDRGWSSEQFEQLWSDMIEFSKYSFNKCVSGDTVIKLYRNAGGELTVRELYEDKLINKKSYPVGLSMMYNTAIVKNNIAGIYEAGVRQTYRLTTRTGKYIVATENHKLPTPNGDTPLSQLSAGDLIYISHGRYSIGKDRVESIVPEKEEMTYDVEMQDPFHTYVVNNGIVSCNSHSSAYAILAYMTAKEKAYYPEEFFAGLLNSYIGESNFVKEHVKDIAQDIERHNIVVEPIRFGQDNRKCSVQNGRIVYAIPLIKDCNQGMADYLYEIRDFDHSSFSDLVMKIRDGNAINSNQMNVLISLGYFEQFGSKEYLRKIIDMLDFFKYGNIHEISKDKLRDTQYEEYVSKFSTDRLKDGSVGKRYKVLDIKSILGAVEASICDSDSDNIRESMEDQLKYMGFINLTTNNRKDIHRLIITDEPRPIYWNGSDKPFTYVMSAKSICTGKSSSLNVKPYVYEANKISKMDIIDVDKLSKDSRGYWYLWKYSKIKY